MDTRIQVFHANTLDEVIRFTLQTGKTTSENLLYFRGENKDFKTTALQPGIYRNKGLLEKEHLIFREMQRFNDQEFITDKTAFDKLARMQHYTTPTRMLDMSEDILSGLYFALDNKDRDASSVLYLLEIDIQKIKYYDSDSVSILANLAKSPLTDNNTARKSKKAIWEDAKRFLSNRKGYNEAKLDSKEYLLHDIREEKSYFADSIQPDDLFSVLAVKPKLNSQRIQSQKGAFLLFGLNQRDVKESPQLLTANSSQLGLNSNSCYHPLAKITKIILSPQINMQHLEQLGVSKAYIYPELDHVSEYLKAQSHK